MASQLGRIVLASSGRSEDEQVAALDEQGSYGELLDAIDELLRKVDAEGSASPPGRP